MNGGWKVGALLAGVIAMAALGPIGCTRSEAGEPTDPKGVAAVEAARAWLALSDAGRYGEAWQRSSAYLKGVVPEESLTKSLEGVRTPLGEVRSREVASTQHATSLPGAPDGEYVIIQFETSFAHKQSAVETVTPMLEADGTWRVSGYYIR